MPLKDPVAYKEYQRAYRIANKDKLKTQNVLYRQQNAERIKARSYQKYWADPEKARALKCLDHQKHKKTRNLKTRLDRKKAGR